MIVISRLSRPNTLIVGLVAATLLLAACGASESSSSVAAGDRTTGGVTQSMPSSDAYPTQVRDNFVEACIWNGGWLSYCECALDYVEARVSLDEYMRQEVRMVMGTASEDFQNLMADAVLSCAQS